MRFVTEQELAELEVAVERLTVKVKALENEIKPKAVPSAKEPEPAGK